MTETTISDCIELEIFIAAPADRIFQALTDPAKVPLWWGTPAQYRVTSWSGEICPGGAWRSEGAGADGTAFHVGGEYLEVSPPHLLVHTWKPSWDGERPTLVRFDLLSQNGGTLVKVRHSAFGDANAVRESHAQGWLRVLGWMQAFVERNETIDNRGEEQ
jgi:uncharacterized protein YndB with AHSA1/START domain